MKTVFPTGSDFSDRLAMTLALRRERGRVLFVAGPAMATLGLTALPDDGFGWNAWTLLLAGAIGIPAGAWLPARPRLARAATLVGFALGLGALYRVLSSEPAVVVLAGTALAVTYLFVFTDPIAEPDLHGRSPGRTGPVQSGLAMSALVFFLTVANQRTGPALIGAGISGLLALALAATWAVRSAAPRGSRIAVIVVLVSGVGLAASDLVRTPGALASVLAFVQLLAAALVRAPDLGRASAMSRFFEHPARVLVATFAALCALGTALLALPASTEHGVSATDAVFTSVSAVCVTGLAVVDTPSTFTPFGEGALLALIQVGGLGIMTFYTVALAALGKRMSLRHERALAGALNIDERNRLLSSVRKVFLVTGLSEGAGAALLTLSFLRHGDGLGEAIWRAVFTSVSAFCNAGFALQSDSLVAYQDDPLIVHTVGALIVLGGLSPTAVVAIPRWVRGKRVEAPVAMILVTSAALIVVGAVGYGLMEWSASLGHLSFVDRLHNAWFQSITLRTAGFNSVDLMTTRPATQTLMIVLMFVGGCPGGTAGGVKTTTLAVLLLTVTATLRGHADAFAFGRSIGRRTVYKAASVITVGVLMVFAALVAVDLTQVMAPDVAVFEVVSALATVGLSIGGTAALDEVGKVIIILCMFAGRVGPLTLFLFLAEQRPGREPVTYPEVEVDVG